MKRTICLLLILCTALSCFFACAKTEDDGKEFHIVVTVFPEYDWICNILGAHAETIGIRVLMDSGTDLHSYQTTADDLLAIRNADLFVYIGGESDGWVEDALRSVPNDRRIDLNLMECLGDRRVTEEELEGMQHEAHDGEDGEEGEEFDEHIWLSLRNAAILCEALSDALCRMDSAHAEDYRANLLTYTAKLNELDARYTALCGESEGKTLLFADRFPFRYMARDYGLTCYAAFSGCSAESEASFETVYFLAQKVNERELNSVLILEGSDGKIAQTVIETSGRDGVQVLKMDSLQSVTAEKMAQGVTYLSVMESNLTVLRAALQ